MSVHIVRLGSPRAAGEGLRLGTVRRSPRGVAKSDYAKQNWYDVWFPNLAPSAATLALGRAARSDRDWSLFLERYRAEMAQPEHARMLDVLAALSHTADFAVGCYCADEARCHRSALRALLAERGAMIE